MTTEQINDIRYALNVADIDDNKAWDALNALLAELDAARAEPKILSTDDFYALLRILEVLPIADPFITALQSKLSDEERRQHGSRASHLSGPEFAREIERIEALIQSRVDGVLRGSGSPQEEHQ